MQGNLNRWLERFAQIVYRKAAIDEDKDAKLARFINNNRQDPSIKDDDSFIVQIQEIIKQNSNPEDFIKQVKVEFKDYFLPFSQNALAQSFAYTAAALAFLNLVADRSRPEFNDLSTLFNFTK